MGEFAVLVFGEEFGLALCTIRSVPNMTLNHCTLN